MDRQLQLRARWLGLAAKKQAQRQEVLDRLAVVAAKAGCASAALTGVPGGRCGVDRVGIAVERKIALERKNAAILRELATMRNRRLQAMDKLTPAQYMVLTHRYFYGRSLRAVGKRLGKSEYWVRQRELDGLASLDMPADWIVEL